MNCFQIDHKWNLSNNISLFLTIYVVMSYRFTAEFTVLYNNFVLTERPFYRPMFFVLFVCFFFWSCLEVGLPSKPGSI